MQLDRGVEHKVFQGNGNVVIDKDIGEVRIRLSGYQLEKLLKLRLPEDAELTASLKIFEKEKC